MSESNLFGDDPALDPSTSAQSRLAAILKARTEAYASRLFLNPPIRSCNESEVGTDAAKRNCNRFAKADTDRVSEAERNACLTVVSLDRLMALETALNDWLTLAYDDEASGGNGSEDISYDELKTRTSALLDATTIPLPAPGGSNYVG